VTPDYSSEVVRVIAEGFVRRFMGGVAYLDVTLPDGSIIECDVPQSLAVAAGLRERRRFRLTVEASDIPDLPVAEMATADVLRGAEM
jgi:hypothetical protein